MFARVTTIQGGVELEAQEAAARLFHEQVLPAVQGQPGFRAVYLLVDASQGKLLALSLWESEAALQASEALAAAAREQVAVASSALLSPTVEHYEVLASHSAAPA